MWRLYSTCKSEANYLSDMVKGNVPGLVTLKYQLQNCYQTLETRDITFTI